MAAVVRERLLPKSGSDRNLFPEGNHDSVKVCFLEANELRSFRATETLYGETVRRTGKHASRRRKGQVPGGRQQQSSLTVTPIRCQSLLLPLPFWAHFRANPK